MSHYDVVVLGGGPAALAAAAACAGVGLSVARVDPTPGRLWANTYGVWVDQLDGLELESTLGHRWDDVVVVAGSEHELDRSYAIFDNGALAATLTSRGVGVEVVEGRAVGANHDRWQSTAILHDGRFLDAAVLIDATGHWPVVVHRAERPPLATQVAYGVVARCEPAPYEDSGCVLMDWSSPGDAPGSGGVTGGGPSFLYALDLGFGWWLLEETSLASRPAASVTELEARLHSRLAQRGVTLRAIRAIEEVDIPLGLPVPTPRQRAVGLGASASGVHPASGYSVGASLQAARPLADAIAQALERRATPEGVSAAAWAAVWPADRRRARALEEMGAATLLRLDQGELSAFFDAFFSLPAGEWYGYLTGALPARQVARVMRHLFVEAPPGIKAKLAMGNPLGLLRAIR